MKAIIQLLGPLFTVAGCGLSIYGTFLITRVFHPFRPKQFWITVLKTLVRVLTFQLQKAIDIIRLAAEFAINPEDRAKTLVGVFLIFGGFLLQCLGAVFWGLDVLNSLVTR